MTCDDGGQVGDHGYKNAATDALPDAALTAGHRQEIIALLPLFPRRLSKGRPCRLTSGKGREHCDREVVFAPFGGC
jgi:hypothetical protein